MFPGGLEKGRTHLSSGAGNELRAQDCFPGGLTRPGTSLRVRYRLRSVGQCLEQVQDPAWFSSGTKRWVQECLSGLEQRQGPTGFVMWALEHLLWCKRGSSQNASAPGSRCQLGTVIRAFEDGQHLALCHARPDIWAQGFLSVHPHEKKLA